MRKDKFIELIQRQLSGGDVPSDVKAKYHEKVIELWIGTVYNKLLWGIVQMGNQIKEFASLEKYTKSFFIDKADINYHNQRKKFWIDTPVPVVEVPGGEHVRYVGPPDDEGSGFIPRDPRATKVYQGLDVEVVDQGCRYMVEHDKIIFIGMTDKPESLLIKQLVPFESFDSKDDIAIPGGQDSDLINGVIQIIRGQERTEEVVNNDFTDNT